MDILRRLGTEPQSAPAQLQKAPTFPQQTPTSSVYAARTRDPNAPENKYQVTQKCIYERQLPGGSYITAHLQRLQFGYYDTPVTHEDLIDNVRFVAINFVFHPSRDSYRFKSAEIRVALHNIWTDNSNPLKNAANIVTGQVPDDRRHSHATQTSEEHVNGQVVKYGNRSTPPKVTRPKFLRHAPHLLYGAISPETLNWNFNVAGSVGISQAGASASLNPSGGMQGSYKIYEMMKIQGSMRTLRSWYDHQYDIEDGEIVWTLEENALQKSGLPREFTFVMLLTKGSSNLDQDNVGDLTLEVDIKPKVAGFLGKATFPSFVTNLLRYQPYRYPPVNLDLEIGQIFEPSEKGRGFNFARLSSQFDDYVFMPGTTHSQSDDFIATTTAKALDQSQSQSQGRPASPTRQQQSSQQNNAQHALPATDGNTLNLRVFLENARGSPAPLGAPVSYLHLHPPSRNRSPLPPASVSGSQRSQKRTITITSQKPSQSQSQSRNPSDSSAAGRPRSYYDGQAQNRYEQPQRRQQSLRKTRSRSELNSEYNSSPVEEKAHLVHDFRSSPVPEQRELVHDVVTTEPNSYYQEAVHETPAHYRARIDEEGPIAQPQPDSQTLPQHEFVQTRQAYETPAALQAELDREGPVLDPAQPHSGTEGTSEWRTPPETTAELQPSPRLREKGSRVRSRPASNVYSDQPANLRTKSWSDDSLASSGSQTRAKTYHSHASQAESIAEESSQSAKAQAGRALPSTSDPTEHATAPPKGVAEDDAVQSDTRRPFSYAPVQEALNLAMAEHGAGVPPGSTPSHGFGGGAGSMRKLAAPPTIMQTASSSSAPPSSLGQVQTKRTSITALPAIPATPPLRVHKRDISTSSSMGEATGVWNDSPPDWTSPGLGLPRSGGADVTRSYSQRIGAGATDKSNTSSPAGSVRRKKQTRTIRYSYPAVEQADRYYRERTGENTLQYGDERRGGDAESAIR